MVAPNAVFHAEPPRVASATSTNFVLILPGAAIQFFGCQNNLHKCDSSPPSDRKCHSPFSLKQISGKKREIKVDPKIAKKLKVEFWQAKVHVVKTAHGRGRGGEDESEWTICALKGDKKTVAAAAADFKAACESLAGKQGGGKLPSVIACGFAEFITKIASTVKPPSIPITNRAKPGEPPLHIQKKKRKAGESGDADDMPLNKLQKKVLPYAGKKRGPKSKAEKALAAMAAGAADDIPLLFMLPKKPMPLLPKRVIKKDKTPPRPKKLPYPGKKRGPKTKAEKAAMAIAAAAEAEADDEISLVDLAKKKIPYTGKKRGPKTKAEKEAIAAAAEAAGDDVTLAALASKKPYTGKKRGPKTKAEKAAEAAAKSDDAPISAMMVAKSPKKRGPKPKGLVPQSSAAKGKSKGGKKVMGSLGDE